MTDLVLLANVIAINCCSKLHTVSRYSTTSPNLLPDDQILDWSKLNQSADDNFEFEVNSESSLFASNFSFFQSVFKRLVFQGRQNVSLCGNGLIQILRCENKLNQCREEVLSKQCLAVAFPANISRRIASLTPVERFSLR